MNIFKKVNTYKIYCDLDKNERVRKFAEKHSAAGTVVETRAHGYLLSKNLRVTITFKSHDHEAQIYRAFIEEFRNYDIKIHGKSMSVQKEAGLT